MSISNQTAQEQVLLLASLLELPLPDTSLPGVVENWQRLQQMAILVEGFPLPEEGESDLDFKP